MGNDIVQVFEDNKFGELRIFVIDEEPWFLAKDVCDALGLSNVTEAVRNLDDDEKSNISNSEVAQNGGRNPLIISESGFYKLAMRSRKPEAKSFQRWVTHEVLPSIRRHGMYATPQAVEEMLADPDTMIATLQALKAEREKVAALEARNRKLEVKAAYYDTCMESDGLLSIRAAAKLMKSYDRAMGQKRLFAALRADGMVEQRTRYATAKAIERGYMKERQFSIKHADGHTSIDHYGCLTPKGLGWCIEKYCIADPQPQLVEDSDEAEGEAE